MPDEATTETTTTETPAAPPAGGTPPPASEAQTALSGTGEPTKGSEKPNGADPAATEAEKIAEPTWPDDWRERLAGDDEAELKRLRRYQSFENFAKANRDLANQVKAGQLRRHALPENASDSEVADYRKAWGIPEKPEDYGVAFPEGMQVSDADKADLAEFTKVAHDMNAPPALVKGMADWYFGLQERSMQQMYDAAQEQTINRRAEVKAEMGRDFDRNVRLAKADLASVVSAEKAEELVSLTLADGTKLGDHPDFIRYAVGAALRNADDEALVTSDLNVSGKTLEEQWRESLAVMNDDPKKFHTPEHQARHQMLAKAITAQRNKSQAA